MANACRVLVAVVVTLVVPNALRAQAQIAGTVTGAFGRPIEFAEVTAFVDSLELSVFSETDGAYLIPILDQVLPDPGSTVTLTVRSIGYRSAEVEVRLERGQQVVHDFVLTLDPLRLDEIVVTGQGFQTERRSVGNSITTVRGEELVASQEQNVVSALSAKAPNVEVSSSAGDPGVGSYVHMRGFRSFIGGSQPMVVVDGTPISNASDFTFSNPDDPGYGGYSVWGPLGDNRAMDLNPRDIESIEILKGAAATSLFGSRAANGVIVITTKSGRPNTTRATFSTSYSVDKATHLPELQTRYGQGLDLSVIGEPGVWPSSTSWGPALDPDTPVYDHAGELFKTGYRTDNSLSLSGGTDRTTYYFSLGYLKHEGTIRGASDYQRTNARLNGSHQLRDNLTFQAHLAYTTSKASLINHGSDLDGLLLGGLRTPPEYNNLPYLDPETGLHRSYRCSPSCLTDPTASRGFDNPFWVANEVDNDSQVDRTFGSVTTTWGPTGWLELRDILGIDFSSDRRSSLWPQSSSWEPEGRLSVTEFVRKEFDHTIMATGDHAPSPEIELSLTLGHNMNKASFEKVQTNGFGLIQNAEHLDFVTDVRANQYESAVWTTGLFGRMSGSFFGELFLNAGVRYDGSDTFGGDIDPETGKREPSRFWYPEFSASWEFGRHLDWLGLGRFRIARGESGTQPPPYSNVEGFESVNAYQGREAVSSPLIQTNSGMKPERTREWEVGGDIAVWENRLSAGVTHYWQQTTDAILVVGAAPETGYQLAYANGASWRNWGWEVSVDAQPLVTADFTWTLGVNWGRNQSVVDDLLGQELVGIGGFLNPGSALMEGHPFGVLAGDDFVRFGRGIKVGGVDIDSAYQADAGALFIAEDGFPVTDPQVRKIADPSPDWTGSLRSALELWGKVRLSALLDIKKGGDMYNGTKGALFMYGTHKDTEPMHGTGVDTVFAGAGPGAGKSVNLNWDTWGLGKGSPFQGPRGQFVEKAGYVKLREVTLSFSLEPRWLSEAGLEGLDVFLSGRNLATWTDYTGIDPESNLMGQTTARGFDYFGHPQTRSLVIGFTLRR